LVTLPRRNNFRFVKKACLAANNDLGKTVKWQKQVARNTKFDIIKRAQTTRERAAQNKKAASYRRGFLATGASLRVLSASSIVHFISGRQFRSAFFEAGVGLGAPNRPFVVHLVAW
jgi:hypothetical protein